MASASVRCGQITLLLVLPILLSAQSEPAPTITTLEISGVAAGSERFAREVIQIKAGDILSTPLLDKAVVRLLHTGRFLSARYKLDQERDGVRVLFELAERSIVKAIRFNGASRFREGKLRAQVSQKIGSPVDWLAVRDGRDAILALYRAAGYGDVAVTYDPKGLSKDGVLAYSIQEGRRVRIRRIRFEGNRAFDRRTLQRNINTKKALWIFRSGAFDQEKAESDVLRLQEFYRDQGFLDARVSYRRALGEDGESLTVVFAIDEGTRYQIETIEFHGNHVFSNIELMGFMSSQVGNTVRPSQVEADAREIQKRYGELGYIYATVRALRVFSNKPGLVRITMEIVEKGQYRVGRVLVHGNTRTRDKVVRRALNLYPPDDLFDLTEAGAAQKRLLQTRIFSAAHVYPAGDQPGVRDVVMDVKEAEKAGDFLFGAGVTSNAGLIGNIVLDLQNFDLFNRPRSWSELLKLRSFFGGGQHLRIELQPGTQVSRFRLDFTEPYLLDKPLRLDVGAFLFQRSRENFDERRAGVTVSFGKRFERGRFRGWSGELALRAEDASVRNVDVFAGREIRDDKGSNLLTSIKGTLVRDRSDNRFVPTSGDRLRFSYEQFGVLGGDHAFGKLTAGYTWYKTLSTDLRDRKRILQLKFDGGAIVGDAPVIERFFAGGTGSIRGFEFRGIGERDGLEDTNIGGDFRLLASGEYTFPLIGDNVRGLVFLDTAAVGSGGVRASIGAGVRFTINLLGPVPFELDLAAPISTQSGDDTQTFSFLIGRIF